MDFFECQEFFKKMNPGKSISFTFDDNCIRSTECVFTDACPHLIHHICFNKVKVAIEEQESFYIPIAPHRSNLSWVEMKRLLEVKKDVFLSKGDIENAIQIQEHQKKKLAEINNKPTSEETEKEREECLGLYRQYVENLVKASGMSQAKIEEKIEKYKELKA